jgi:hypothetical protein
MEAIRDCRKQESKGSGALIEGEGSTSKKG